MTITDIRVTPSTEELREIALRVRHDIVDMCAGKEGGHVGGSMSCTDVLTALYFSVMRVDPAAPLDPDRDIFILSKGHAAIGLYAILAERGYFPVSELSSYGTSTGRLMAHPVCAVPGIEMPTGSLGHGLSLALGFAVGARLARSPRRSFVLVGDGELQEGSCWEAAMCAGALMADNLIAVVDRNGLQLTGATERVSVLEPLADRWRSFGWSVRDIDGHDHGTLVEALSSTPWESGRPSVLITHTRKGEGLSFMAGKVSSHYATFTPLMRRRAHQALDKWAEGWR